VSPGHEKAPSISPKVPLLARDGWPPHPHSYSFPPHFFEESSSVPSVYGGIPGSFTLGPEAVPRFHGGVGVCSPASNLFVPSMVLSPPKKRPVSLHAIRPTFPWHLGYRNDYLCFFAVGPLLRRPTFGQLGFKVVGGGWSPVGAFPIATIRLPRGVGPRFGRL